MNNSIISYNAINIKYWLSYFLWCDIFIILQCFKVCTSWFTDLYMYSLILLIIIIYEYKKRDNTFQKILDITKDDLPVQKNHQTINNRFTGNISRIIMFPRKIVSDTCSCKTWTTGNKVRGPINLPEAVSNILITAC